MRTHSHGFNPAQSLLEAVDRFLVGNRVRLGAWELEPQTRRFRPSASWARMVGLAPQHIGAGLDTWLSRVHQDDRGRVEIELRTHVEGLSDLFECEYRMRHEDGSVRWMRACGKVASEDADGVPQLVTGHQEDITERRKFRMALEASEARFRTLIENAPDAIAVHRDGHFRYVNRRMLEMLGYDRSDELEGAPVLASVHPDDVPVVTARIRSMVREERDAVPPRELRLLRKDGRTVVAEVSSIRLEFDGEPSVFAVCRDVTARSEIRSRLAQQDRMALMGAIAAGVAHEINNPLTFITSNLQLLIEDLPKLSSELAAFLREMETRLGETKLGTLTAKARRLLDPATFEELLEVASDARIGAERVARIVTDLKKFTRSTQEQRQSVDLRRVIRMAAKMATHEFKHRLKIVEDLAEVPLVLADEARLSQVFLNLLVNAVHAIRDADGQDAEIRLSLRRDALGIVATVSDTGCGIDPEHMSRLFDPFFTTKPSGVGSGLGLPICQHIVEGYGGRLDVESELGKGTTVTVRLPAELLAAGEAEVGSEIAIAPPSPDETVTVSRPRVLIVDDEALVCRALSRRLSRDYDITIAKGGEEAIAVLDEQPDFALILCDVWMVDVSGEDVFHWLQQHRPELAERVVFITGAATSESAQAFLREVDNVVVDKPVDIERLKRLMKRLIASDPPADTPGRIVLAKPEVAGWRVERRRGQRYRAHNIGGFLECPEHPEHVLKVDLVDYSLSGFRLRTDWPRPPAQQEADRLHLVLVERSDESVVQADVRYVRRIRCPSGADFCVEMVEMSEASRDTYSLWLERGATPN